MSEVSLGTYGVVRVDGSMQFRFSKVHENITDAINEAKRLAAKEKKHFIVVKLIGEARPKEVPVEWNEV